MDLSSHIHLPLRTRQPPLNRADEVADLLEEIKKLIIPFIAAADNDAKTKHVGRGVAVESNTGPRTTLVEYHPPQELAQILNLQLPKNGAGKDGLLDLVKDVLRYSVNTWDQGFMDKLYASTNAVGVVSELLLSVLNTNAHVYAVSPVLTLIEKTTTKALASLIGYTGPHAGGISQPGGSASNQTSIIIARNTLYPETKTDGNGSRRFVLFTSAHGHYSLEKAAQMFGFGSKAVIPVAVDEAGRMNVNELEREIQEARTRGQTPFYVNATAGTTVLGSFDPINKIAVVCKREKLWLHVDGSWGGPVIFSQTLWMERMQGVENADSVAITPHKMLGVPMTCSFLIGKDLRQFHAANTLPAGYLFHKIDPNEELYDLADLTPQCGRRGDSLKLFLGWTYYGTSGYCDRIENAFNTADYLFRLLYSHKDTVMVSQAPLPCLQVCFYWANSGKLSEDTKKNSEVTEKMTEMLVQKGWMVDHAPGEKGKFFRVVVGGDTRRDTVEGLVKAFEQVSGVLDGESEGDKKAGAVVATDVEAC